jgi:hypothetical protein
MREILVVSMSKKPKDGLGECLNSSWEVTN